MADFRKWLFAFAPMALLLGLGSSAMAQQRPFTCTANAGNPTIVRQEGITELVGDIVLACTGGTPTALSTAIPQSNITLSLNTNITSRLLSGASGYIDALLLIDEPVPTAPNPSNASLPSNVPQSAPCYSNTGTAPASPGPAGCNVFNGTGGTTNPYAASPGFNVFVARQLGANTITWLGVPIDAPGSVNTRVIRLTNVRGNACQLGSSTTLVPTMIVAFIGINGSQNILLNNPQVTVAFISQGLVVSGTASGTLAQCVNLNSSGSLNFFGGGRAGEAEFAINVREGFAASFKRRVAVANGTSPIPFNGVSDLGPQNVPGFAYNTESGFMPRAGDAYSGGGGSFGLADSATRFLLRFNNIGSGTRIVLPIAVPLTISNGAAGGNPVPVSGDSQLAGFTGGFLRLLGGFTDQNGNTAANVSGFNAGTGSTFSAFSSSAFGTTSPFKGPGLVGGFATAAEIPVTNGSSFAVYEVVNADPFALEQANIPVGVGFTSNTGQNLPATGQSTVSVSFAPLSTVGTADTVANIPRFCDTSTARNSFLINTCSCNLLFPFITNQAGFDTGFAIANTSLDPFGTATQSGTITLNFYGNVTGGGAAPAAFTTPVIAAGTEFTAALSNPPTGQNWQGFQGYMIAQARFQYCHGFAFISDLGAQRLAEGYLAIQLDVPSLNRTNNFGENEGH